MGFISFSLIMSCVCKRFLKFIMNVLDWFFRRGLFILGLFVALLGFFLSFVLLAALLLLGDLWLLLGSQLTEGSFNILHLLLDFASCKNRVSMRCKSFLLYYFLFPPFLHLLYNSGGIGKFLLTVISVGLIHVGNGVNKNLSCFYALVQQRQIFVTLQKFRATICDRAFEKSLKAHARQSNRKSKRATYHNETYCSLRSLST